MDGHKPFFNGIEAVRKDDRSLIKSEIDHCIIVINMRSKRRQIGANLLVPCLMTRTWPGSLK